MNFITFLLVLVLLCGLPQTGWHDYGYAPSGLIVIIIVLLLIGRI